MAESFADKGSFGLLMTSKIVSACFRHASFQVVHYRNKCYNRKPNFLQAYPLLTSLMLISSGSTPTASLPSIIGNSDITGHRLMQPKIFTNPSNTSAYTVTTTSNVNQYKQLEDSDEDGWMEPCSDGNCDGTGHQILSFMNESVDPCDDFYDFACQRWTQSNPQPSYEVRWNDFRKLQQHVNKVVIDIMNEPTQPSELPALTTAKQYYQACINTQPNDLNNKRSYMQFMLNKLENYGGWPILYENDTWNITRFDWINSLVSLRKEFEVNCILTVNPEQRIDGNFSLNSISINPVTLPYDLSEESLSVYKDFIVNVSKELLIFSGKSDCSINTTYLEKKAWGILYVERNLVLLASNNNQRGLGGFPIKSKFTVSEAQTLLNLFTTSKYGTIDIIKLLNTFYNDTGISINNTQLLRISSLQYLIAISDFLYNTKEEAIANYLHFKMVLEMTSWANIEPFNGYLTTLNNAVHGIATKDPRYIFCAGIVQKKLPLALGYAFLNRTIYQNAQTEKSSKRQIVKIEEMTKLILNEFDNLVTYTMLPYVDNTFLRQEIRLINICLRYSSHILDEDAIAQEFESLNLSTNYQLYTSFLQQTIIINAWRANKQLSRLILPGSLYECNWKEFFLGTVASWTKGYTIYVPTGIQQRPFYYERFPSSLNYGKLGLIIGHEIAHTLFGLGWTIYENGNITPVSECFINQYNNYTFDDNNTKQKLGVNGVLTLEENVSDNAGMLASYRAYKANSFSDCKHKLKGLEKYSNDQLFFIGFAQNWCGSYTEKGLQNALQHDVHSPDRFRVLGTLQNSKEFSEIWNCPVGSKMNPVPDNEKCPLF